MLTTYFLFFLFTNSFFHFLIVKEKLKWCRIAMVLRLLCQSVLIYPLCGSLMENLRTLSCSSSFLLCTLLEQGHPLLPGFNTTWMPMIPKSKPLLRCLSSTADFWNLNIPCGRRWTWQPHSPLSHASNSPHLHLSRWQTVQNRTLLFFMFCRLLHLKYSSPNTCFPSLVWA
jgi:hypothetical protein